MDEKQRIQAILDGDHDAFASIVNEYQGMVYKVCLKMTNDSGHTREVAQDVFIQAYKSLASFRAESAFSTWLYQVTVRKCLDWRRLQKGVQKVQRVEEVMVLQLATEETPEREILRQEQKKEVQGLLEELPEPYLTAVRLFYYQQFSYQEIAEQTGIPVRTVESQLYRARKMLRRKGEKLQ